MTLGGVDWAIIALYIASNFIYLSTLPLEAIKAAPSDRVGTAVMQAMFGDKGAGLMAAAILISMLVSSSPST